MEQYKLLIKDITKLISELLNENYVVLSQSSDNKKYKIASGVEEVSINPFSPPSDISVKELFFPENDTLFYYKKEVDDVRISDIALPDKKCVVFGVKPCDAASVPILSKVFNWDYKDDFFNQRVNNTVIIGLACNYRDEHCFCTSVGLSPENTKGSDLFLTPVNENEYLMQVVTEKGNEFASKFPFIVKTSSEQKITVNKSTETKFDYALVKQWLDANFENEFWNKPGELCLGCAKCAFACPTCHCFDIVDEDCSYSCGKRVKNWDSCQFGLFTKHASGHNPRNDQSKRYRQRIMHKFKYYNDRFDEILCTGCGRCSRGCPVSISISEILSDINSIAQNRI